MRYRPEKGASVSSMRCRYSLIPSPKRVSRMTTTAYAVIGFPVPRSCGEPKASGHTAHMQLVTLCGPGADVAIHAAASASATRASVPQRETQHVKELYAILENRLGIILNEEVTVNARDPKAMLLVEGKLIAKGAGAHHHPVCSGSAKEINDPFQDRRAMAEFLADRLYGDV